MADEYEATVFKHDFQRDAIMKALDIVRKFIIMNKRILVGGMGMDLALRSVDSQLYKTEKLPDYDFYSPIFHADAYTIGEQLIEAGLTGISIIRATHVSTMRVRVNYVSVADVTYIPHSIYENIPTIIHEGITICHPHYQIIDQHISLSLPFGNPPMETILGRWKKDIERYDIIYSKFPINIENDYDSNKSPMHEVEISTELIARQCLAGYAALLYWIEKAIDLGYKPSVGKNNKHHLSITRAHLTCKMPKSMQLVILSDTFITLAKEFKHDNVKYINAVLDKIPRRIDIGDNISIIDNKGRLITAIHDEPHGFYISSLQEIMAYMLTLGVLFKNDDAIYAYKQAQGILFWACDEYTKNKEREQYEVFLPIITTYGAYNWAESYIVSREDILVRFKYIAKEIGAPKDAHPDKDKPIDPALYKYDPSKSKLYQIDGREVSEFQEKILPI